MFAETTFARSKVAKLRKRIFLPLDLYKEVLEERFICDHQGFINHRTNYDRKAGWTQIYLDARVWVLQAKEVEIIRRTHKLGRFILFRVWKTDNKSRGAGD